MQYISTFHKTPIYNGDVIKVNKSVEGQSTFYIDNGEVNFWLPEDKEKHKQPIGIPLGKFMEKVTKITLLGNTK